MSNSKLRIKKILIATVISAVFIGIAVWFLFAQKFEDTKREKSVYTINALDLIKEFQQNDSIANKKYAEKIMTVIGIVTEVESADITVNIKMGDTTNGSYVIFAFQQQNVNDSKTIKEGDKVSIKGSCSGGAYSKILETEFITFKRCALNK